MRIFYLMLCSALIFGSCSNPKNLSSTATKEYNGKSKYIYFDEFGTIISKSTFKNKLKTHEYFEIPGDSANHKKLTIRLNSGNIEHANKIYSLVEEITSKEIDKDKPLVIIYYPGKDRNNSGGTAYRLSYKRRHDELVQGLNQIAEVEPIYIFHDNKGLEEYEKAVTWYPDKYKFFQKNFFKYHYPGYSFVVISSEGKYISYFGEFSTQFVFKATHLLRN